LETTNSKSERIAVIGLGYVGLPVAVSFARAYEQVVVFDISKRRIEALGYYPEVILAGRRINDDMGRVVARETVTMPVQSGSPVRGAKVGKLGLTFKENVPDIRNSKVADVVSELSDFGIEALVHDPCTDTNEAHEEYGLKLRELNHLTGLDALILAVNHRQYLEMAGSLTDRVRPGGVLIDVKSALDPASLRRDILYWSL
jgi:UDP-N-acetyl-D-galactosamine dehydrogenase